MAENRVSVDARRILKPSDRIEEQSPGDFAWEFDFTHFEHGAKETDQTLTVYICLPGNKRWSPIHVRKGPAPGESHVWGWDGNLDRPTFMPSIHEPGTWHGFMEAGRLRSI